MSAPHLLILDEPTNHLDIDSRRALLDALNDYEGAVILITHDRSLIDLVADRLWLTADGEIKPFNGDMDEYARFVARSRESGLGTLTEERPSGRGPPGGRQGSSLGGTAGCRRGPLCRPQSRQKTPPAGSLGPQLIVARRQSTLYKPRNLTRGPWL